jgi:hypothetical protein
MGATLEYEISGPREPSDPYAEPPPGVKVVRAKTTIGFDGLDQLALSVLAEAGKAAMPVLAKWLYDTFRSRRPQNVDVEESPDAAAGGLQDAHADQAPEGQSVNLTINGNVYLVRDEAELEQILRHEADE